MPQPTTYDRQNSFTLLAQQSPSDPYTGADLDEEFNAIKVTLDEVLANLELIQRDDGDLANGIVGTDQLGASVELGVNPPEAWVTATVYAANDTVFETTSLYRCLVAHTSGTFATDLAAAKWVLLADFNTVAIEDGAVTEAKIATGAVTAAKIGTGAVSAAKIASDAVTTAKILDANVTAAKLATNAVTTDKITDEAVTYAKIQNVSATDKILGRSTSGAGEMEEIACVAAARTFLAAPTFANVTSKPTTIAGYGLTDAAAISQVEMWSWVIETPEDGDYDVIVNIPYACTINSITTDCVSGTATLTGKINTTALGGTANSVSTTEDAQTHSSANSVSAGDNFRLTVSSNSSCERMTVTVKVTRTLA